MINKRRPVNLVTKILSYEKKIIQYFKNGCKDTKIRTTGKLQNYCEFFDMVCAIFYVVINHRNFVEATYGAEDETETFDFWNDSGF